RGSDPTERLMRVIGIVKELESGKYPDGPWVRDAPQLVSGFFVSREPPPVIPPENIERMLSAYTEFVRTHWDESAFDLSNNLGYILSSKIADLHRMKGDVIGGMERTFAALESSVSDAAIARMARAHFYLQAWTVDVRAATGEKARAEFTAIARGDGYLARRALATLAAMAFYERDYARAVPIYQDYLAKYPAGAWAWVARLRLGQSYEAQGDWTRARDTYLQTAVSHASLAPVAVLGLTFAARADEALGEFDAALESYRKAIASWDSDYGAEYSIAGRQAPVASGSVRGPIVDPFRVRRVDV